MVCLIRGNIRQAYKITKQRKHKKSIELIGCTPEQLKLHLETQFTPDMSWDNQGYYGCPIDHIIPLNICIEREVPVEQACHYANLQPLWYTENLSKHKNINKLHLQKIINNPNAPKELLELAKIL